MNKLCCYCLYVWNKFFFKENFKFLLMYKLIIKCEGDCFSGYVFRILNLNLFFYYVFIICKYFCVMISDLLIYCWLWFFLIMKYNGFLFDILN